MAEQPEQQRYEWVVGPEHGAERLLVRRSAWPAGFFVGLHRHDGEEAFYVLDGEIRFTLNGEHSVCRPGEGITAPTGSEHGFLVLADATILIFREQRLQSIAIVVEPDGTRREVEIYQMGPPWSNDPPPGSSLTPNAEIRDLYQTTYHLL